jgi:Terminase RNaseH-like domain
MSKWVTFATWDDVPHLSAEAKEQLLSAYHPNERDARSKGVPSLGAGAIYPVPESEIVCEPFRVPLWYRQCYGMDVGWNRTAAIWGALDPESDVLYLHDEHYRAQAEPPVHAAAINARGSWIPGVIDPASRGRSQHDGQSLLTFYQRLGLRISVADNSVESGIYQVWLRLSTGRLKVFSTLRNFMQEYRIYRRDEKGAIVKENDHLLDALRYMCMSGVTKAVARPADQRGDRATPQRERRADKEYDPMESFRRELDRQRRASHHSQEDID